VFRIIRYIVMALLIAVAAEMAWGVRTKLLSKPSNGLVTAPATVGDVEETVLATGTLKPIKMVAVGAQLSGRIVSLKVAVGQTVRHGQLIAQIDPVTKQNDLRTAEAALSNMRAQREEKTATLALAESSLARQQLTLAQKASSRADFETAEATVRQTRAQIASLDAQIMQAAVSVENARVNLDYTRVVAPIDGTVLAVVTQEGQTVNAVQSAPTIVILGQVETMAIRAEISEVDVIKVRPGQEVYFTILGDPDHRYQARLESIEPAPDSVKSDSSFSSSSGAGASSSSSSTSTSAIYYNGIFSAANPEGQLRTYMTAEVHIVVASARSVLTIPSSALSERNRDGSWQVEVVDAKNAVSTRNVSIGINNKLTAQVLSGLSAGEQVVTRRFDANAARQVTFPGAPPGF
jgi:membrane fusion protein, macrolide-specific efflux system